MENWKKYEKTYFMPPEPCYDWVKKILLKNLPSGAAWISATAIRL